MNLDAVAVKPIEPANINELQDTTQGMIRTEVRSTFGDSHLGHVFPDAPSNPFPVVSRGFEQFLEARRVDVVNPRDPAGRRNALAGAHKRYVVGDALQTRGATPGGSDYRGRAARGFARLCVGTREPRHYQRMLRREPARQGDRHL